MSSATGYAGAKARGGTWREGRAARRREGAARPAYGSHVEAEEQDVAVLDHVLLALGAHQPLLAGGLHRAGLHEVVPRHRLRADEAALEVGVDDARRLRRLRADRDLPRAHF